MKSTRNLSVLAFAMVWIAAASGATITWDGGGNGASWTDRLNWSGDTVPGPIDDVVINEPATNLTIIISGHQSVNSLINNATLWINGNRDGQHAQLAIAAASTNTGIIQLESPDGGYNSLLLPATNFVNAPSGQIVSRSGSGGARAVYGHLINRGLVDATTNVLDLSGTYDSAGGQLSGQCRLRGVNLRVTASPPVPTILDLWSLTTLLTDNMSNTVLWVHGNSRGDHATLTANASVTNYGTILLESSDGGYIDTLNIDGTLVNATTGVLQINQGSGGARTLAANFINQGIVNVAGGTSLYCTGAGKVFRQEMGNINATGSFTWADGRLDFVGGAINGTVYLRNGLLDVAVTAGASTVFVAGNSTLLGNRSTQTTVWVQGNSAYNHATLTTAEGAVNAGTIHLQSANGGYQSVVVIGGSNLLNQASGVIESQAGSGGARSISGYLINQGLVDSGAYFLDLYGTYEAAGGQLTGNCRLRNGQVKVTASAPVPTLIDLWDNCSLLTDNLPNTTLWVHGGGNNHARLTISEGVTNFGVIRLESTRSGYECRLQSSGTLINETTGRLEANEGTGGARIIDLSLRNHGIIQVANGIQLYGGNTNQTFEHVEGDIATQGNGLLTWANGLFRWQGGNLAGAVYVLNGTIDIGPDAPASTLRVTGENNRLVNNLSLAAEIWIQGNNFFNQHARLVYGDESVNVGRIRLESSGGGYHCSLAGGTLTNAPTGLLECRAGSGGSRLLNGSVINQGLILATSGHWTANTDGGTNRFLRHTGGRLATVDGLFSWYNNRFEWTDGEIEGQVFVVNSVIDIGSNAPSSTLRAVGSNLQLAANRSPAAEIWVNGNAYHNEHAILNATENALNLGRIRLESTQGGYTCGIVGQALTNGPTGIIESFPGSGGGRLFNAELHNAGVLRSYTYLNVSAAGAEHRNAGRIELNGNTLAFSGVSLVNESGGLILGSGALEVIGLSFTNAGILSPGASPGRLTVKGSLRQTATGQLEIELGGSEPDASYDWLEITGSAVLEGSTLVTRLVNDFVPDNGASFRALTANGGLFGQFSSYSNLHVHAQIDLEPVYSANAMDLLAVPATNAIAPPRIVTSPTDQKVLVGGNAIFLVTVNGTAPFTYQWIYNGYWRETATNSLLTLSNVQAELAGGYSVLVANSAGTATSSVALLTVTGGAELIWRWDGSGDQVHWSDPRNWQTDRLPPPGARVLIDATNTHPNVRLDVNANLSSLISQEAMSLDGSLLVLTNGESRLEGPVALNQGGSIQADGPGALLTLNGMAALAGNLYASHGAQIHLPNLSALTVADRARIVAGDGGSLIDFPKLTNLTVEPGGQLDVTANSGAEIRFSSLDSIMGSSTQWSASGNGSTLALNQLSRFHTSFGPSSISALDQGRLQLSESPFLLVNVTVNLAEGSNGEYPPVSVGSPATVLFGSPWRSYRVEVREFSATNASWTLFARVPQTNTFQAVAEPLLTNWSYRVSEFMADQPVLDIKLASSQVTQIVLFGATNKTYVLEATNRLQTPPASWPADTTVTMTNSFRIWPDWPSAEPVRFFRAREP